MAGKTLDPHLWNLENLFKSIYDVPVYQRPYSWDIGTGECFTLRYY